MSLTPRHRHLIDDIRERAKSPLWPWLVTWIALMASAIAAGAIWAGGVGESAAWRPLWGGVAAVVSVSLIVMMALALAEERRDHREDLMRLVEALKATQGGVGTPERRVGDGL